MDPASEQPRALVSACVGLGSNLGDRAARLLAAVTALRATAGVSDVVCSSVYETDPVGPAPQGPYLNAAARLRTSLTARELLERLLAIERMQGRRRTAERFGPRSLDLDLLLFGELRVGEPGLIVPHPRLHERGFVLEPLAEIAAEVIHPLLGESIAVLARRVRDPAAVRRLPGPSLGDALRDTTYI